MNFKMLTLVVTSLILGTAFAGPGHRLKNQVARQSQRLLHLSYDMAGGYASYAEREALASFDRFNRVAQRVSNQYNVPHRLVSRYQARLSEFKSQMRTLRAFSYYRHEFRDLRRKATQLADSLSYGGGHHQGPGYGPGPGHGHPPYGMSVRCQSFNQRYSECPLNGRIRSVRLRKKHSEASCNYGEDFGFFGNVLWVDNGCRASFQVEFR